MRKPKFWGPGVARTRRSLLQKYRARRLSANHQAGEGSGFRDVVGFRNMKEPGSCNFDLCRLRYTPLCSATMLASGLEASRGSMPSMPEGRRGSQKNETTTQPRALKHMTPRELLQYARELGHVFPTVLNPKASKSPKPVREAKDLKSPTRCPLRGSRGAPLQAKADFGPQVVLLE